jgi:poly(ADP-ribose) glycohydrolase ARH3
VLSAHDDGYYNCGMSQTERTSGLAERFCGCVLGQAVGDAMGAPFETMPGDAIYYGFGSARKIMAAPPVDRLVYTDDTQMMIGVAETLIERGRIDESRLMQSFSSRFDPLRGYGPGTQEILEHALTGGDWKKLSATIYPGGSFGNGAAMRVAPIGLFFSDDLDRVEAEAESSAVVTHGHPIGIDGACLLALAVALVVREDAFNGRSFYEILLSRARTEEFRDALSIASRLTLEDSVAVLGNSLEAHRSVVTSIACFACQPESYVTAVGRAIGLGGDVDTLAAMTGALSGAHLGPSAIPSHLIALLEDGPEGRTYLEGLSRRLHSSRKSSRP